MSSSPQKAQSIFSLAVIVASLGYFVDIYDLLLFTIVRVPSLKSLGLTQDNIDNGVGLLLINVQMAGLLLGGILWGMVGDKRGRLSVLFGSILLYSIANIANGFVSTTNGYLLWRFVAGLGLAGELGAGITLVSEILPKEKRGYGTMIVATVGVSGAVAANFIYKFADNFKLIEAWRVCYFIGGALGLGLLVLRVSVAESGMYAAIKSSDAKRGSFLALFSNGKRFMKYLQCILLGTPTWFVVGILMAFSNKFGVELHVQTPINPGDAVAFCYTGLVIGDFASGYISQLWRSRKKVMILFLCLTAICSAVYLNLNGVSATAFYTMCFLCGISVGFWAIFVTIGAESFGTNVRATVATTVPNFARGMLLLITALFKGLQGSFSYVQSGGIVACITIGVALIAAFMIPETFGKDLDYTEEI